jgi:hypothetical protein
VYATQLRNTFFANSLHETVAVLCFVTRKQRRGKSLGKSVIRNYSFRSHLHLHTCIPNDPTRNHFP